MFTDRKDLRTEMILQGAESRMITDLDLGRTISAYDGLGQVLQADIGKVIFIEGGHVFMENATQRNRRLLERIAHLFDFVPNEDPVISLERLRALRERLGKQSNVVSMRIMVLDDTIRIFEFCN